MQAMAACLVGTSLAVVSMGTTLPTSTQGNRAATPVSTPRSSGTFGLQVIDDYGFGRLSLETEANPHLTRSNSEVEGQLPDEAVLESEKGPVSPRIHTVSGRETLWSIPRTSLVRRDAGVNSRLSTIRFPNTTVSHSQEGRIGSSQDEFVLPPHSTTSPGQEIEPESVGSATELSSSITTQHGGAETGSPTLKNADAGVRPIGSPRHRERGKRPFLWSALGYWEPVS